MAGQILSQFRRVTCSQCHCCGYFIGKERDVRGNLGTWYFAWKLSTISVAGFYFGKFKNYLHFLRTKEAFSGVWWRFVCLEATEACCRFPKIKSCLQELLGITVVISSLASQTHFREREGSGELYIQALSRRTVYNAVHLCCSSLAHRHISSFFE